MLALWPFDGKGEGGDAMKQSGSLGRLILIAAVIAGVSYFYVVGNQVPGPLGTIWKGAGVGLLALYAALQARSTDGWLIALVMACGALGDVLLDAVGMTAGAVAFILGHVTAIALYLRNRRDSLAPSQKWLATLVLPLGVLIAVWSVPFENRPMIGIYTGFVAAMAAAAWISRFPRYRTGIGAMMFLASDLLIFARMGPFSDATWVGFGIWGLYFAGQVLIVLGVTQKLSEIKY
jgi:uncharacterized membrane protein YhhN